MSDCTASLLYAAGMLTLTLTLTLTPTPTLTPTLTLTKAGLPAELSKQIHTDACSLGKVVGSMCPFASVIEIKLEVHGENVCSRWHQDWYAGRECPPFELA